MFRSVRNSRRFLQLRGRAACSKLSTRNSASSVNQRPGKGLTYVAEVNSHCFELWTAKCNSSLCRCKASAVRRLIATFTSFSRDSKLAGSPTNGLLAVQVRRLRGPYGGSGCCETPGAVPQASGVLLKAATREHRATGRGARCYNCSGAIKSIGRPD